MKLGEKRQSNERKCPINGTKEKRVSPEKHLPKG